MVQVNRVCLNIIFINRPQFLVDSNATEYESVILTGRAVLDLDADERMKALKLLLAKLSPDDMEVGLRYAEKSFGRTAIIRLDITHYSGKSKVVRTF